MDKKTLTDIQINQATKLKSIDKVALKAGIKKSELETHGDFRAKLKNVAGKRKAKLILVTAINPTPAGEGKTTTSIGLAESMNKMGHKTLLALREPSLGPVFGVKGGATGGGYSQIAPIEDINLHFTGDIHAITSANNLIAAAIDNHIYWGNALNIHDVVFRRCLDMNDRSLRNVEVQVTSKSWRQEKFQITAASEIMAIFTLAKDLDDLRTRVENIVAGYDKKGKAIFVKELNIAGSVVALLKDAFRPNVVQTLEGNPALIHGGPFANIAHGCNSIVATDAALKLSDYVITEAGFGADLGAEKFLNIKTREANLKPNVVVIVATIRALKMQGGVAKADLNKENVEALEKGIKLLEKHVANIKNFNLNYVVALNAFSGDFDSEVEFVKKWAKENKHPYAFSNVWAEGGNGGKELAEVVLKQMANKPVKYTYELDDSIKSKIDAIAKNIYGAVRVEYSPEANASIKLIEKNKLDKQYICMAKTPASITDNPVVVGIPKKWALSVTDVTISNGAKLIVVHCGSIMTMPGLSKKPQAEKIDWDGEKIIGLD